MDLSWDISIPQQAQHGGPGEVSHPTIQNDQLRRLSKCSPLIELHWWRLQPNLNQNIDPTRRYTWSISSPDIEGDAICTALERVSNPETDHEWLAITDVENLSRYCGALWFLNVVPELLPSYDAWKGHRDIQGLHPVQSPHTSLENAAPLLTPTPSSNQAPAGSAATGSTMGNSSNGELTDKLSTSLATARAALVLGQRARFNDEITAFLDMMPGDFHETSTTPIRRLRVDKLKEIRLRELTAIQNKVRSLLKDDPAAKESHVERILSRLPNPHHDTTLSISTYHARFKHDLLDASPSSHEKPMPTGIEPRPAPMSGERVVSRVDRFGNWVATWRGGSTKPVAMRLFLALEKHLSARYLEIADDIWEWRNAKVRKWGASLTREPDSIM
ncbi:hypothetical protein B0T18DRAFT_420140 [Schizothecium vesticola]|uniref:Uncharacterized protein n=1 Tax=Schizothecium vesticola TaxID=314040 RepID=A0AA40ELC7_9PEZI|nr:hypothetical protein B0T18DRAFT_420140 [Schizothecium vesticola]